MHLLHPASNTADICIETDILQMELKIVPFNNKNASLIKVTELKSPFAPWGGMKVWTGIPSASLFPLNRDENLNILQLCWIQVPSVEVEFKVERSWAKWVETLETSMKVLMMMMTLLALWIHGVFPVVKLSSHL